MVYCFKRRNKDGSRNSLGVATAQVKSCTSPDPAPVHQADITEKGKPVGQRVAPLEDLLPEVQS